MEKNLIQVLDAITIFSNIEVCTIDQQNSVNNISHHTSCPRPILEAYMNFFSGIFLKYDLNTSNIYYLHTDFGVDFYLITMEEVPRRYIIGPFLTKTYREKELKQLLTKQFDNPDLRSMINYYRMLPVLSSIQQHKFEALLQDVTLLELKNETSDTLMEKETMPFVDVVAIYRDAVTKDINERYRIENRVLDCIRLGTPEQLKSLGQYVMHKTNMLNSADRLRNIKNLSLSGNTLFRKAAEQGGVPPLILDKTSRQFAFQIENTTSIEALETLQYQMILDYCQLVQSEKQRGYSAPLRKVIHYIENHLEEPLSLDFLAELINRNPKYLSTIFKKEVGIGLNDYINKTRINHSLPLLHGTELPISHIAVMFGFSDSNYFTKVFSKEMDCTPSQYRRKHI